MYSIKKRTLLTNSFLTMLFGCCVVLSSPVELQAKEAAQKKTLTMEQKLVMKEAAVISVARTKAISAPDATMKKWMNPAVYAKWQKETAVILAEKLNPELPEFFSSSVVFCGKADEFSRCWAYYNVWQDVIMLVEVDRTSEDFKVEDFIMLPGSIFRKEIPAEKNGVKDEKNIVLSVIKCFQNTEKVFNQLFSKNGKKISSCAFYKNDSKKMTEMIQQSIWSIIGAKLHIADNPKSPEALALTRVLEFVYSANTALDKKQVSDASLEVVSEFYKLPQKTRKKFLMSYAVKGKDGIFVGFTNSIAPSDILFAYVSLNPAEKMHFAALNIRTVNSAELSK